MYTQILSFAFFTTSILAAEFYSPGDDFGAMLKRGDAILKRQGYYPTTHYCGLGSTCQEACGPSYVQCPSTDSGIHCYDPTAGYHCCTDGAGHACEPDYYCTSDGAGNTYCCPDGIDIGACAASYSLTISLIRESSTALPSAASTHISNYAPASTTPIHISFPTATATVYPTRNATYTTSPPPEFTGAAARVGGSVMAVLAGAAGLVRFL